MKRIRTLWCCPLLLAAVAAAQAASVGTAFTYQGRLTDNGAPASGTHNFVFRLCSGNVCNAADVLATYPPAGTVPVSITNGLFTVPVDFGANMFMTDARWLEIVVDGTTLCPRQELTPTPFALALPGLWTQQNATSPNIIGGQVANSVTAGVVGATISGGGAGGASNNRATDNYTTIGGGADNQAGNNNANLTDATYATAAGGSGNNATSSYTSVGGGRANTASQAYGTVGGGRSNNVSGQYGTIAGGGTSDPNLTTTSNRVSDSYGTVAGGGNNRAGDGAGTSSDKPYASVGGGEDNQANGAHSAIPGGQFNRANGTGSLAAGRQAQALHDGSFVWSDGTAAFASTATNQFLVRATNGMGIGVVPGAGEMLSVGGLVESTSGGFKFPDGTTQTTAAGSSLWTAIGSDIYNANAGSVGIGTSAPAMKLDVNGSVRSSGATGGALWAVNPNNQLASVGLGWLSDVARIRIGGSGAGATGGLDIQASGDASLLRILDSGEVGVGTPTPLSKLHISGGDLLVVDYGSTADFTGRRANGTSGAPTAVTTDDSLAQFVGAGHDGTAFFNEGWIGINASQPWTTGAHGTYIRFLTTDPNSTSTQERMRIDDNGYVGIGTAAPTSKLQVQDGAVTIANEGDQAELLWLSTERSWVFRQQGTGAGTALKLQSIGGSGDKNFHIQTSGNVGIGAATQSPAAKLHVVGNASTLALEGIDHSYIEWYPDGVAAGRKGWMGYGNAVNNNISIVNETTGADIELITSGSGVVSVSVLEITGADVAERFSTSEPVEPGMVVEIDADNPGQLRLCRTAYNRRVAGVVSGAGDLPVGAILGNLKGCEDAPPIALSGRVWVRCDASSGAIEPGDLLTTSDMPGHAMKLLDFARGQGAIVGKAMSKLAGGETGLVLVLVNLQ